MSVQHDLVFGTGGGQELRLDVFTPPPERSLRTAPPAISPWWQSQDTWAQV